MSRKTQFAPLNHQKSKLPNGLRVVTERVRGMRGVSVGLFVAVGPTREPKKLNGVSHFIEHMVFKGTERFSASDISKRMDAVGGEFNAYTEKEFTCFHFNALKEDLRFGIELLEDLVCDPLFLEEEVKTEKKVILEEIKMDLDSPDERVTDLFFEKVYRDVPLGRPILGEKKTIAPMTRRNVVDYFKKSYCPSKMVLTVCGDVDHKMVLSQVQKLKKLKKRALKVKKIKPPAFHRAKTWLKVGSEQVHVYYAFDAVPSSHKDRLYLTLLSQFLADGMASFLFQEIREKRGLAYHLYSDAVSFSDAGYFHVYMATSKKGVKESLRLAGEGFDRLKNSLVDLHDLSECKKALKRKMWLSLDSCEYRMNVLGKRTLLGLPIDDPYTIERLIDKIRPKQLKAVANRYFVDEKKAIVVLGPRPKGIRL